MTPVLKKSVMLDKADAKAFEELQKVLTRLKKGLGPDQEGKNYVYLMQAGLCALIIPPEVEEAIRRVSSALRFNGSRLQMISAEKASSRAIMRPWGRKAVFI